MQKTYMITGGLGLIGSNIANKLPGRVVVLSRSLKHKSRLNNPNAHILLKPLDQITKSDLQDVSTIYHCASTVDNYNVLDDPYIDVQTNINSTIHLLETCRQLSTKPKIIYLSTFFVYGNQYEQTHIPITEESKTDPLAIYPATKLCAENIIRLYAKLYDLPYLIFRLTNVYGEQEEYNNKKKGALNFLIMSAINGAQINLYQGGNFYRDYIHVDDVVSALMTVEPKINNDLFLVGWGKPVLFKDIINHILSRTSYLSKVVEVQPPAFHKIVGITNFVANTEKILSHGWKPKIDYQKGLDRIIAYYRKLI